MILEDPAADELAVVAPTHLFLLVERDQRALHLRQTVERNTGEIVVLEMVVRVQECKVPEPVPAHERAPLSRIGWIDVVVLAQAIQREGNRKNEEDRDDARPQRRVEAEEVPEQCQRAEVCGERELPFDRDPALQLDWI